MPTIRLAAPHTQATEETVQQVGEAQFFYMISMEEGAQGRRIVVSDARRGRRRA
jgi:hypothetical protein